MTKKVQKKDYNKIEAKDNMVLDNNGEEVSEVEVEKRERPKQVVDTPLKERKQGLMERLVKGVLGPEGLPGIGAYLNEEIIVPSIKHIIVESITSGINMAVFGDKGTPRSPGNQYHNAQRRVYRPETQYHSQTRTSRFTSERPEPTRRDVITDIRYPVREYEYGSKEVANDVLLQLREYADRYQYASVADYYDTTGTEVIHTDYNYGWDFEDLVKNTNIVRMRNGMYIIDFPTVITL